MRRKGPAEVDSLMHIPLIWRPALSVGIVPRAMRAPGGYIVSHPPSSPPPGCAGTGRQR